MLRLVITSDGVEVIVIIRSIERYDLVKVKQQSRKQSFRLCLRFRRLVFTSDGVGVGVVIRSAERYDLVKIKQRSRKQNFLLRLRFRRLRSSENQIVGVVSKSGRTKPITKRANEHCDWFILPLLLPTPTIWFSLDRKRRNRKKMETF